MSKKSIILVGGGGHCKSCIDVIESENKYNIIGIIDLPETKGSKILSYDIIGDDGDIETFAKKGYNFLITIGHMGNAKRRAVLYDLINFYGGKMPTIISPYAHVSRFTQIGNGTIIMHNSIINSNSKIGHNCILNTKALLEHDTIVGNNCHISTDVNVNGGCVIEDNVFIGSATTLINGISICSETIIGAGSLILESIVTPGKYYGIPAKAPNEKESNDNS